MDLDIHLERWTIEDGNYDDFKVGETRRFALEFYAARPLSPSGLRQRMLEPLGEGRCRVVAEVAFAAPGVCVLDFGMLAYAEDHFDWIREFQQGDWVEGELLLGVDSYFYFEYLHKVPGIPPLIYEWEIHGIERNNTPFVQLEGGAHIQDEARKELEPVENTNKRASLAQSVVNVYILHCSSTGCDPAWQFEPNERQ